MVPIELNANFLEFDGKEYACSFTRDITERKKAEIELRNAYEDIIQLKNKLHDENTYLKEEIKLTHNFEEIITQNQDLQQILESVESVATTNATVLITGETGTGKELIARAIHNISKRCEHSLLKVNCAALPSNLIESELFGHEKGAFTGAHSRKIGRFELADGGTIFLDEIGELPLDIQPKLLKVLQDGKFERLGESKARTTNVRVIAATNRNLENEIKTGQFRNDLFYRLNVFPIHIPPLRMRKNDIPLLVKHFVKKISKQHGKKINRIPDSLLKKFQAYQWPGNIRELENIIERAIIISNDEKLEIRDWLQMSDIEITSDKTLTLRDNERQHILSVLKKTNWRVSGPKGAAKILDINPQTLFTKLKKLNIHR